VEIKRIHAVEHPKNRSMPTKRAARLRATEAQAGSIIGYPLLVSKI
jgi:hypothetical protein